MRHSRMKNAGAAACAAVLSCLLAVGPVLDGLAASPVAFAAEGAASQKAGGAGQGSAAGGGQASEGADSSDAVADAGTSAGAETGSGSQANSGSSQGSSQLQQELPLESDATSGGAAGSNAASGTAEGAQSSGADANAARVPHITADGRISGEVELSDQQTPAKAGTIIYDGVKYVVNPDGQTAAAAGWHGDVAPAGDLSIAARVVSGGDSYRVTSVSDEAFKGCEFLRTVTLPDGLESVGKDAFAECPALESFLVGEGNAAFATFDGMLFDAELETLIRCPEGKRDAALLPDTAAVIEKDAFAGCAQLASITAGPDNPAFATVDNILYTKDRTALLHAPTRTVAAVVALETTTIAEGAFAECSSLASVLSLGAVEVIEDHAFAREALESAVVALAAGDDYDARKAVWEQAGFSKFQMPAEPGAVQKPAPGEDGFVFELLEDYTLAVSWGGRGEPDADLSIPTSGQIDGVSYRVSAIAPGGFAGIERLTNVQIRAPIAVVGDDAFAGCANLSSVIFEEGVSSIGAGAFSGTAVESVAIPASVSFVGAGAFSDCSALSRILAFSNAIDVASDALSGCSGVAVYCPVESEGAYPWNPGLPVAGNHILPYGVSFASEPLVLAVGETADVFEGGVREVPEGCELSYSYAATPLSVENGQATGKKPGTSEVSAALTLDGTELARATRTVEVREAATADDPADEGPTQDGDGAAESADEGAQDPSADIEESELSLMSLDMEPRMLSETLMLEAGNTFEATAPTGQALCFTVLSGTAVSGAKRVSVAAADVSTCTGTLQIPGRVVDENDQEYAVVSVATEGFRNCKQLVSVTIPDTIELLASDAFNTCIRLKNVEFKGSNLKTIDTQCFAGCRDLEVINIPGSVTKLGQQAFGLCASLQEITIPDSVTTIGGYLFESCSQLKTVVIGSNVSSISLRMFSYCTNLRNLIVRSEIKTFQSDAFYLMDTSVLSVSVVSDAQRNDWIAKSKELNYGIEPENISVYDSLATVTFEAEGGEFASFSRFVPKGQAISEPAAPSREGYSVEGWYVKNEPSTRWDFSKLITGDVTLVARWVKDASDEMFVYKIRSDGESASVSALDASALSGHVEINESYEIEGRQYPVREIASYGFADAINLTSVFVPASVEIINVQAFARCAGLESVEFEAGSNLTSIETDAFSNAPSLKAMKFPASLVDIGRASFYRCSGLEAIEFEDGSNLRVIQDAAFRDCISLTNVTLPDSTEYVFQLAFHSCSSLASVHLPSTLRSLDGNTFFGTTSLKKIELPTSLNYIGSSAFNGSGLESVTLPDTDLRVNSGAFQNCASLKSVSLYPRTTFYNQVNGAFKNCPQLTSVFAYGKMENSNISAAFPAEMKGESGVTIMLPPTAQDGTNDDFAVMAETWKNTHGFANVACSTGDLPAADGSGTAGHWNLTSDLTLEITQVNPEKTIAPLWTDETDHSVGYWGSVRSAVRAVGMDPALKTVDMNKWFKEMPGLASTQGIFIPEGCTNVHELFRGSGLREIASEFSFPDSVSNAQTMFGETPITCLPDSFRIPSANPIDLAAMFQGCKNLVSLPEGFFLPSNVTQAFNMFYRCISLSTLPQSFAIEAPASGTTYARDFGHMFGDCISLGTLPDGFVINKSNVVVVGSMFENCTNLTHLPQSVAFDELKDVSGFDIMFGFDITYPERHEAVVIEKVNDVLARDGGLETYCEGDAATWPDASVWMGWKRTPKSLNDAACRVSFMLSDGAGSFDGQPVWMYAPADDSGLVQEPEPPTYDGKVFTLWYADEACTQRYDFSKSLGDNSLDVASKNVTIYGKYADGLGGKSVGGSLPTKADTGSAFWSITDEGTLYIRGAGKVDIPNWTEDSSATLIEDHWGPYRSNVVKVTMSPSLKAENMAGWFAFMENLTDVTEIEIPSGVLRLRRAFQGCTSLTTLPEGFSLPTSVFDLSCMFQQCSNLQSLPESFVLDDGIKNMQYMFWKCSSLSSLPSNFRMPDSVVFMSRVFGECASLRSLPSNFSIASVKAGEDTQAFFCEVDAGQPLVPTYYAGNNPSVVDYDWASQNRELIRITAGSTFEQPAQDGTCFKYTVIEGSANGLPAVSVAKSDNAAQAPAGDIVVPETVELEGMTYVVTSVAESGFANCDKITSIKLPPTVKVINKWAFDANASLASLPDMPGVQVIGMNAFRTCVSLREAVFPATLTTLGALAFEYSGLESATIPASVSTIAYAPFGQCSKLKHLVVEKANANYCVRDGALCTIDGKTLVDAGAAQSFAQDGCYTVPAGVETLGQCAFKKLLWLKGLVLPASCESIGYQAVYNNENLTDIVYLSSSVKNIGLGSISLLDNTRLHCFESVASTFETIGLTNVVPFATGAPQTYELPQNQTATLEFASSIPADLSSGIEVMWTNVNTDIATIESSPEPASTPDKHVFKVTAKSNVGDSFTAEANLVYSGGGSTVVLATSQVTVSIINSRGALPTENNPSNTDENVAGWSLDADGTLRVWSTEKIADFGWTFKLDTRHTEHWGPVRGFVKSVDTTGVKDVNAMTCWFREMPLLTDISKFKIPETTKLVNDVFTSDKALEVIPDNFKFPDEATDISSCFNNCTSIRELPAGFRLPSNVEVVGMLFGHNPYFTFETLREDFFPDTVQNLNGFFYDWTSLETVPADFKLPRDLRSADQLFFNCASLKSIPAGLFDKATELTTANSMFYGCTALEEIPAGFALPLKMTSATNMFDGCTSLRSVPANILGEGASSLTVSRFFGECASLESLPEDFKIPGNVTNAGSMFTGCMSLAILPSGLFDKATNLDSVNSMFWRCSALETVPEGFMLPASITDVQSLFNSCTALRSIPANVLGDGTSITKARGLFYNCPSLTTLPDGFTIPSGADTTNLFRVESNHMVDGQKIPMLYNGVDPLLSNASNWTGWNRVLVTTASQPAGAQAVALNMKTAVGVGSSSYWTTAYTDASGVLAEPTYTPSLPGHVFTLWYADEACTQRMDFSKPVADLAKADDSGAYALYGVLAPGSHGGSLPCEAGTGTAFWSLADDGTLYIRGAGTISDIGRPYDEFDDSVMEEGYWFPYRLDVLKAVMRPGLKASSTHDWFAGMENLIDAEQTFIPEGAEVTVKMFFKCSSLTSLPDGFKLPESTKKCQRMFGDCASLEKLPDGFTIPRNVQDANAMFLRSGISVLPDGFALPAGMKSARYMFSRCANLVSLPSSFLIPSEAIVDMNSAFAHCTSLSTLPEGFVIPSSLRNVNGTSDSPIQSMFLNCTSLRMFPSSLDMPEEFLDRTFLCEVDEGVPRVPVYYDGTSSVLLEHDWATDNRVLITDPADRNMYEVTYKLVKEDGTWETRTTALTDSNGIAPNPGDPQNGNYGFTGWCTDEECSEPFDFSQPADKATTLYGKWIKYGGRDKAVGEGQLPMVGEGEAWWQITIDGTLSILGEGEVADFGWVVENPKQATDHWGPARGEVRKVQMSPAIDTESMSCWFLNMDKLEDLSGFNFPRGVKTLLDTFRGCKSLEYLPAELRLPDHATNLQGMFNLCSSLKSLPDGFRLGPDVKNTAWMLAGTSIVSLPQGFLLPDRVEKTKSMFNGCLSLTSLPEKFRFWNSINDATDMFCNCPSLVSLPASLKLSDLSSTARATIAGAFSVKGTTLVTYYAGNIADLEVMGEGYWTSQNREIVTQVPAGKAAVELYVPDPETGEQSLWTRFLANTSQKLAEPAAYVREGSSFLGWYLEPECTNAATFPLTVTDTTSLYAKYATTSGPLPTVNDPSNTDANVAGWRLDADGTLKISCAPDSVIADLGWTGDTFSQSHWGAVRGLVKRATMTPELKAQTLDYWFAEMPQLEDVQGTFIPEGVSSVNYLFNKCSSLTHLPNGFTVPEGVENLKGMLRYCDALKALPQGFTIPSTAKSLLGMFEMSGFVELCDGLTVPCGVTNVSWMFNGCAQLEKLPASFLLPETVTNTQAMFGSCGSLRLLPAGFTIPPKVTKCDSMFRHCHALVSLPSGFALPENPEIVEYMFYNCTSLTSIPASLNLKALKEKGVLSIHTIFAFHPDQQPVPDLVTYYAGAEEDVLGKDYWKANYCGRDLKTNAADLPTGVHTATFKTKITGEQEWTTWQTVLTDASGKVADPLLSGKFGYAFDGWYTDPQCTTKFAFDTGTLSADSELYGTYKLIVSYDAPLKAKVKLDPTGKTTPVDVQMKSFTPVPLKVSNVSCEAAPAASEILDPADLQGVAAEIYPEGSKRPLYLSVGDSDTSSKLALPAAQPGAPGVLNYAIGLDIPDASVVKLWHDGWSTDVMLLTYTVEPA